MDALGVIPVYLAMTRKLNRKRKLFVGLREMTIALAIMILFYYLGPIILSLLHLTQTTTEIAGGMVMFLIALKLIFAQEDVSIASQWEKESEPFIVPIATPLIAGPSVLSVIMIYSLEKKGGLEVLAAIFVAWFFSCLLFLFAAPIHRLITEKGLNAAQRLMGLIITVIATQMLLHGIKLLIP